MHVVLPNVGSGLHCTINSCSHAEVVQRSDVHLCGLGGLRIYMFVRVYACNDID